MPGHSDDQTTSNEAKRSAYVYDSHRGIVAGGDSAAGRSVDLSADRPAVDLDGLFDAVQQAYKAEGIAGVYYKTVERISNLDVVVIDSEPGTAAEPDIPEESLRALLEAGEIDPDELARRLGGRTDSFEPGS